MSEVPPPFPPGLFGRIFVVPQISGAGDRCSICRHLSSTCVRSSPEWRLPGQYGTPFVKGTEPRPWFSRTRISMSWFIRDSENGSDSPGLGMCSSSECSPLGSHSASGSSPASRGFWRVPSAHKGPAYACTGRLADPNTVAYGMPDAHTGSPLPGPPSGVSPQFSKSELNLSAVRVPGFGLWLDGVVGSSLPSPYRAPARDAGVPAFS